MPEEQLADKISEYAEYIKGIIFLLVGIAFVYFMVKYFINRRRKMGLNPNPFEASEDDDDKE